MSEPGTIKVNLHYGGLMEFKDKTFIYRGGSQKNDIVIDPDYMTWSMFDVFCEENSEAGLVERLWYKLPHEDMCSLKPIFELSSDASIVQMCSEASKGGEVDIFIEQRVSPRVDTERQNDGEEIQNNGEEVQNKGEETENEGAEVSKEREEAETEEVQNEREEVQNDREDEEIIEEGGNDIRFQTFFNDVRNEECRHGVEEARGDADYGNEEGDDNDPENEAELERQLKDPEHPAPAVDTDDEWEEFNHQETTISRTRYSNEKPPYLWLMQTFKSGEEFKDQLLRYVLKTNYDVKLCKWEKTKLAAICTKEKCKWNIYCSVEKPKRKWMVKTYVDQHNDLKSSKAKMLKQGTIARLYKDEARRRPGSKWSDIKDEIMMRYNLSVSKWICTKARRLALDMVIETQRQQFAKLWDYEGELRRSNQNTTTEIVTIPREDGKQVFNRFYVCFESLRNTWKRFCRPIIGLDGAFMKWELKGEILAAVGRDADNRIYPIALLKLSERLLQTSSHLPCELKNARHHV